MFCSSCGKQIQDNSTFCTNCGSKQSGTKEQEQGYTAPKPFQQYSTIDPHQPVYQKQFFSGKQASVGSSGHVSFGNGTTEKKGGGCLKAFLIGISLVLLLTVVGIGALVIFGNSEGISNVKIASQINPSTNEPLITTNTFTPQSPIVYCTLNSKNDPGTVVTAQWWYKTDNYLITSSFVTVGTNDDMLNFSLSRPDAGWPIGDYEVRIYVGDTYATSASFKVG